MILIDIGSSSVKIYQHQAQQLKLLKTKSIPFKNGFDPKKGFSKEHSQELFELLGQIKNDFPQEELKVFGTALFRKMEPATLTKFQKSLQGRTDLQLSVISQEEENHYLELALVGRFHHDSSVLLINIGGGSTELVVVQNGESIERHNIDLGVGTLNQQFSDLNQQLSGVKLENLLKFISPHLPELGNFPKVAFYTGGELNYMQLVGYGLQDNDLFEDPDHPSKILLKDFQTKNKEVFESISLKKLESLMPGNPTWMHGARACSAFAQAIFERYQIEIIIPSDSNLMQGIIRTLEN